MAMMDASAKAAAAAEEEEEEEEKKGAGVVSYSLDELHSIGEKLEKKLESGKDDWPGYLDEAFKNARGKWDPDRSV